MELREQLAAGSVGHVERVPTVSDANTRIQCAVHSETPATYVCRHLRSGVACGFHCSDEDLSDPWPDAWCDLCEADVDADGQPREFTADDLSLLCTGCYEVTRARNTTIPAPLRSMQLEVSEAEFGELARQACDRCQVRQDAVMRAWPLVESGAWFYDGLTRTIRFFEDPAAPGVVADVTVVGSFSQRSHTWLWSWANSEYSASERAKVEPLRTFGEVRGIERFHRGQWPAEEIDGWEVTQIAADLYGADAIYRAPMDHLFVFMLLNRFRSYHAS